MGASNETLKLVEGSSININRTLSLFDLLSTRGVCVLSPAPFEVVFALIIIVADAEIAVLGEGAIAAGTTNTGTGTGDIDPGDVLTAEGTINSFETLLPLPVPVC